jgi:RNA polymerase sigma-70 factor (ECF subfamily)
VGTGRVDHDDSEPDRIEEPRVLEALRAGDEETFERLVETYGRSMRRVALFYVGTPASAEEVVQEAWLGFLTSLDRFEERSSLKTWIFRILTHTAQKRGVQERRSVPFSASEEDEVHQRPVPTERFLGPSDRLAGHWASPPQSWEDLPDDRLLSKETLALVRRTIAALPPNQRAVIDLRDVEGWDSKEVCSALQISEGNQRVLLHRARSSVRSALEEYLDDA